MSGQNLVKKPIKKNQKRVKEHQTSVKK